MEVLWVDKFVPEMKELIMRRKKLVAVKDQLKETVSKGYNFFLSMPEEPDKAKLISGTKRMVEVLNDLSKVEKDIFDIDTIIASSLEMYLGNFTAKVYIPDALSQAGDVKKGITAHIVPFKSDTEEMVEISPDDIWFLKMIKEAVRANNIIFESKEK